MSVEQFPLIEELKCTAVKTFERHFKDTPNCCGCAPGRVNLIGEHTDYNNGFVLPMAIPMVTLVVGKKTTSGKCRLFTLSPYIEEPKTEFDLPTKSKALKPGNPKWANYVKGVVANFPGTLNSFDAVIATSVPVGAGLSSSAALEAATFIFLETLNGESTGLSLKKKALVCQQAEHEFPQMPCGIMDQFISFMGEKNHALLIDCRSLESKLVQLNDPDVAILITNSNVRHELTGSEYPTRQKHCISAAKRLGKESLRDAKLSDLNELKCGLPPYDGEINCMYHRVKHVITEIQRTVKAVEALENGDYKQFGQLMTESHISLRDEYEVSCNELDQLVEAALEVDGVYGSRMTGGGFGGCTVTLLRADKLESAVQHIQSKYTGRATFYVCQPSQGAHQINI